MDKNTLIIIVVVAAVVLLLVVILLVRCIRRASRPSNPLPPPQPLAHHREQELAKFHDSLPRTQTWYQPAQLQLPSNDAALLGSKTSLFSPSSPSLSASAEEHIPTLDYTARLPLPNPSFHPRPGSSSSFASSSSSPDPTTPPTGTPPQTEYPFPPHPRASSGSSRGRPLSMSSSHSTLHSRTSRNTLRGTPHSRHSQIQVVLPAPLALESPNATSPYSSLRRPISFIDSGEGGYDRRSIADRWVSAPSSENVSHDSLPAPTPTTLTPPQRRDRASSASSSPVQRVPPVPPVPSIYKTASPT